VFWDVLINFDPFPRVPIIVSSTPSRGDVFNGCSITWYPHVAFIKAAIKCYVTDHHMWKNSILFC